MTCTLSRDQEQRTRHASNECEVCTEFWHRKRAAVYAMVVHRDYYECGACGGTAGWMSMVIHRDDCPHKDAI